MELTDRILTYVTKVNGLVSLDKLVTVSAGAGFSENEVLIAIDKLGKKLKGTVRGNQVYYSIPPPPKPTSTSHIEWVNANYPRYEYDMPFPEIDMSWIVLKPEEMKKFKIDQNGGYRPKRYNRAWYNAING